MKVKIGKNYEAKAKAAFACVLDESMEFNVMTTIADAEVEHEIVNAAALTGATIRLQENGWSLDRIIMFVSDAYKNGWDK